MELIIFMNFLRERKSICQASILEDDNIISEYNNQIRIRMNRIGKTDDGIITWLSNTFGEEKLFSLYKNVEKVVEQGNHQGWNDNNEPIVTSVVPKGFIELSLEIKSFLLVEEKRIEKTFADNKNIEKLYKKINLIKDFKKGLHSQLEKDVTMKEIESMDIKLIEGGTNG